MRYSSRVSCVTRDAGARCAPPAPTGAPILSRGNRERPGAHLVSGAAERIPVLDPRPQLLAGVLGLVAQLREVQARQLPALQAHRAVDDDRLDVVADAAIDEALDRIPDGAVPKRVAS